MAKSNKRGVYLTDETLNVLGKIGEEMSLSGRINQIISRYGSLIKTSQRSLREILTEHDWFIIKSACISWATRTEPGEILFTGLALEIEDGGHGGEFGDMDWQTTLDKVLKLTPVQILAVIEVLESE